MKRIKSEKQDLDTNLDVTILIETSVPKPGLGFK